MLHSQLTEQSERVGARKADFARQTEMLNQAEDEVEATRKRVKQLVMSLAELIEENAYSTRYDLALAERATADSGVIGPTEQPVPEQPDAPSP